MSQQRPKALWGGRFTESTDAFVQAFTASVEFDRRMAREDIQGSIAHATMLAEQGILTETETHIIIDGLRQIEGEIEAGEFSWSITQEDVHMNVESRLIDLIGDTGKKLHTGRSRNDQVATDIRLWLRNTVDRALSELTRLQSGLVAIAEREAETIMPGFTHLQAAQPVTFGHHILAWNEMLERDAGRLIDCRRRMNQCPLGAAALAGTSYPINRERTAELLGFDKPTENSLDSVSDRDFGIEFLSVASIIMMHLSRFSEELINWNSTAWKFVDLPDRFCTGSSIMPQKKNPDVPELVRGKSGRMFGHLIGLLTLMKGQPLAYNKDNQEDKEPLYDAADTLLGSLRAFADMMPSLVVNKKVLKETAICGYSTATDLADYLVRKGLPFREAHEVVGQVVALGVQTKRELYEIDLSELQAFSGLIGADVFSILTVEGSVSARDHLGGTAPVQVKAAAARAKAKLQKR
ncbi:MAG: argininosuccinate lyase [Gammaproteobacteria bacterium]|nr:argininosuccinate lyase [Gammaproteobacteria bacterium]